MVSHPNARSNRTNKSGGAGCLILFGLVFALLGSFAAYFALISPLMHATGAQDWISVPATILESRVGESDSDDGSTTYRVEVRFSYRYRTGDLEQNPNAPLFESSLYDFSDGMYSGERSAKEAIVAKLPPGTQTTCFVNPDNPTEAVLRRDLSGESWFVGFLVLLFPAAGIFVIGLGIHLWRKERRGGSGIPAGTVPTTISAQPHAIVDESGPLELKPMDSRVMTAGCLSLFALIWNGFVWGILGFVILPDFGADGFSWIALIFLSVFAFAGLVILILAIHQILALGNARLRLTLNRRLIRPGDVVEISWECSGNTNRVKTMTLSLVGRESATYTRGTDTVTDTKDFRTIPIVTMDDSIAMLSGKVSVHIPTDAVPTFIGQHNKLQWILRVRGVIPRWPDISDDYEIRISPQVSTL